jgi:hypothetical protein
MRDKKGKFKSNVVRAEWREFGKVTVENCESFIGKSLHPSLQFTFSYDIVSNRETGEIHRSVVQTQSFTEELLELVEKHSIKKKEACEAIDKLEREVSEKKHDFLR